MPATPSTRALRVPVHLKVETGLNRYGLPPEQLLPLAESLRHLPGIDVEGLWTHFATGDETDKSYVHRQFRAFTAVAEELPWIRMRHVANTGTVLDMPELSLDMVRVGHRPLWMLSVATTWTGARPCDRSFR